LAHADRPLAWALIARLADMPGGADCLLANTQWVRPDRPTETLGVFLVLVLAPAAFTIPQYPEILARAAAIADDHLIAMIPFVIGQGPLTAELIGELLANGFWQSFFARVMQSQAADLQRMAIYLVTLFLPIGWIELFGTYLEFIVQWMELPEIAGEVLAFIVDCSLYHQAIDIIEQTGLLEYFQGLADDPTFGALAQTLLGNVAQNRAG
jgi:hypothetical protein